jgi:hypothetical protein
MAHFARLDENNVVTEVCVVNNSVITHNGVEYEDAGIAFLTSITGHASWRQTSYNGNIRKNYAAPGYVYDAAREAFIPPQPFPSWVLDEGTCLWYAPIPVPSDGQPYVWNEETGGWELIAEST